MWQCIMHRCLGFITCYDVQICIGESVSKSTCIDGEIGIPNIILQEINFPRSILHKYVHASEIALPNDRCEIALLILKSSKLFPVAKNLRDAKDLSSCTNCISHHCTLCFNPQANFIQQMLKNSIIHTQIFSIISRFIRFLVFVITQTIRRFSSFS